MEEEEKPGASSSQVVNFPPNKSTYFPPNMCCNHFHIGLPLKPISLLIFRDWKWFLSMFKLTQNVKRTSEASQPLSYTGGSRLNSPYKGGSDELMLTFKKEYIKRNAI